MTISQYDATLTTFSPASTRPRARVESRSGDPSAHSSVLVSSRCAALAARPERFGFFIGERPLPAFRHRELSAHGPQWRRATPPDGHELRHGAPVPLDHHL